MNGVTDHLGKRYQNVQEMCDTYGVHYQTYFTRRRRGFPLEECLLGRPPLKRGERKRVGVKPKEVVDHLGVLYSSLARMCQAYKVDYNVFQQRKHNGFTLEECLKGRPRKKRNTQSNKRNEIRGKEQRMKKVTDHLGKEYKSITAMCAAYDVPCVNYQNRKRRGCSVEECLQSTVSIDHKGTVYSSIQEMCDAYYITRATYYYRKKRGYSLEGCLTGVLDVVRVTDHLGNGYSSKQQMCDTYGLSLSNFYYRERKGYTLEQCLTGIRCDRHKAERGVG